MSKKFIAFVILILAAAAMARGDAPDPRAILDKTLAREYKDMNMKVHLVKISKSGKERPMDLEVWLKKTDEVTKTLAEFTAPAEVAGMRSLSWDYADPEKKSDRWFKLAGMPYTKCVGKACSRMEERFGFSMDIFALDVNDADHALLGEDEVNGSPCYKIESVAKDKDNANGVRFVTLVDKEKLVAHKIESFDKDGNALAVSTFTEFKTLGNHWWETKGELDKLDSGKKLRFEISETKVDEGIDDAMFEPPKIFSVEENE